MFVQMIRLALAWLLLQRLEIKIFEKFSNRKYTLFSDFNPLFCLPTSANTFYSFSNDKLFKRRQYKCARFLENVGRIYMNYLMLLQRSMYCTINLITYLLFNCSPYDIIGSHHLLDFISFSEQAIRPFKVLFLFFWRDTT